MSGAAPRPRRILFLESNTDGTLGGSQRILLEILKHLDRTRYDPYVIFYERNVLVPEFEAISKVWVIPPTRFVARLRFPGLYRRIGGIGPAWALVMLVQRTWNLLFNTLPWIARLTLLMLTRRIDLVCINNAPFHNDYLIACGLLRRPLVSYFRGTPTVSPDMVRPFPRYDAIIPSSHAVTENMRRQGARTDNFIVIYDGIDFAAVRARVTRPAPEVRRELLDGRERPLIGVVNNLKSWKGQHVAVEAMGHLKRRGVDALLVLVGDVSPIDKDYHDRILRTIESQGLADCVRHIGIRSDVPDLMGAFDLVLHTSLTGEGFPRVILETLVLGRPLIASDAGPSAEMVEDGVSGLLVPAGDPAALAARIEEALGDPQRMRSLGARGAERAERLFNIGVNMKATEDLFDRVLAR